MDDYHFCDIEQRPVIIPKATFDLLLEQDSNVDIIALYNFFYYTAVWQKSNICKCTVSYIQKGLKISESRVLRAKKILIALGLVQNVVRHEAGKIKGHFIQVRYIYSRKNQNLDFKALENQGTNALSFNILNALSFNKIDNTASHDTDTNFLNSISIPLPKNSTEVDQFIKNKKINIDATSFFNFYTARGWQANGKPISNWKLLLSRINQDGVFTHPGVTKKAERTIKAKGQKELLQWLKSEGLLDGAPINEVVEYIREAF